MTRSFVLIDLISQRDAVREHLRDVKTADRLQWIASWGTLRRLDAPSGYQTIYAFRSRLGFSAGFFFNDRGKFVFVGDHQTFR